MKRITGLILALALAFIGHSAFAQTQVYQNGVVTNGHVAGWVSNRLIGDLESLGGLTQLTITSTTPTFCINDAVVTGQYHQLCLGATTGSNIGVLTYGAFGGAATQPFVIGANTGSIYFNGSAIGIAGAYGTTGGPLVSGGGGAMSFGTRSGNTTLFMTGTGTFTSGHCPQFDASSNIIDSGASCASSGVVSGTAGNIPYYATTSATVSPNTNLNISSAALTVGVAGVSQGSVALTGAAAGSVTLAVPSSITPYTLTLPNAVPASGQVPTATNGSGTLGWSFPGIVCCTYKNTSFAASALTGYCVDTSGGAVTITLEASPTNGDAIVVMDCFNTFAVNALTVARNGNPIMNIAQNMTDNTPNGNFTLQWDSHFSNWVLR